jgi:hypothetical protein
MNDRLSKGESCELSLSRDKSLMMISMMQKDIIEAFGTSPKVMRNEECKRLMYKKACMTLFYMMMFYVMC